MTKNDLPEEQRVFFDENEGKLQLLLDLNANGTPEYIICGVSDSMLVQKKRGAFFIAMFEQSETGIERRHLQKLAVAPVTIKPSTATDRAGVVLSFAFLSEFAAEIYFENNEYKLERWYTTSEENN